MESNVEERPEWPKKLANWPNRPRASNIWCTWGGFLVMAKKKKKKEKKKKPKKYATVFTSSIGNPMHSKGV